MVRIAALSDIHGNLPALSAVRKAIEHGVNYFDVAPAYGDAEVKLGIALQGIDRSKIVISCKTKGRDKAAALKFLRKALKRHGRPKAILTDGLRSYSAALKDLLRSCNSRAGLW